MRPSPADLLSALGSRAAHCRKNRRRFSKTFAAWRFGSAPPTLPTRRERAKNKTIENACSYFEFVAAKVLARHVRASPERIEKVAIANAGSPISAAAAWL